MSLRNLLLDLLHQRGIMAPDGRPLYAYRTQKDEYALLKSNLRQEVYTINRYNIRGGEFFWAAFVLYAAEWWRREYAGGHWQWDAIFNSIDMEPVNPNTRSAELRNGFAWWRIRQTEGGMQYIGTIVRHGGLPLNAIGAQASANLSQIMNAILHQTSRYHWNETQIMEAMSDYEKKLPGAFKDRGVYELIAQIVLTVLQLKRDFQLDATHDPIEILENRYQTWRNDFPVSIDEDAARLLLTGLVRTASRIEQIDNKTLFALERILTRQEDDSYRLQSLITYPPAAPETDIAAFFNIKNLPGHFYIDATAGLRQPLTVAHTILGDPNHNVRLAPQRQRWSDENASGEHLIHLRGHAGDLLDHPVSIPGGSALEYDVPWVFTKTDDDENYRLAGTGDARLAHQEALIAIEKNWLVTPVDGNNDAACDFGVLRVGKKERLLKRVTGTVMIDGANDGWRVSTGKTTNLSSHLTLEGTRVSLPARLPLFRGLPRLISYGDDGTRRELRTGEYKMFRLGSREPLPLNITPSPGLIELIIEKDGERLGRMRFAFINKNSTERYISGNDPSQGQIILSGWGQCSIARASNDISLARKQLTLGEQVIEMTAQDNPPGYVPVTFKWPGSSFELRTQLPFPATGPRCFDENDNLIENETLISLRKLIGKRIQVFDANPQHPAGYELELTLSENTRTPHKRHTVAIKNGVGEIRLVDYFNEIETLLGFSDNLDSLVKIKLWSNQQSVFLLKISRYDTKLERIADIPCLPAQFMEKTSPEELAKTEVLAVSLSNPKEQPRQLEQHTSEGIYTGSWPVSHLPVQGIPWMIIPSVTSAVFFRPIIYAGWTDGNQPVLPPSEYKLAAAMQGARVDERNAAIDTALSAMAADFSLPSWKFLDHLWSSFRHLPLCCLDVFRRMACNPDYVVAMLFASHLPAPDLRELARRLQDELGLVLEIVPLSVWRQSADNLRNYCVKLIANETDALAFFKALLKNRLNDLADVLTNHTHLLKLLKMEFTDEMDEDLQTTCTTAHPEQYGDMLWTGPNALVQRYLLRVHGDDWWPERGFFEHEAWPALDQFGSGVCSIIERNAKSFFWSEGNKFKLSVANMPAFCAVWTACGTDASWWQEHNRIYSLRNLRAFDPAWFDECYRQSLAACFAFKLIRPLAA